MFTKLRNNIEKYSPLVVVLLIAVLSVRYLIFQSFVPTHDGEYHIIRFWQFDKVFRAGNLLPRWAPDLDHGKGVPIFAFFYPLPNYIAEIFILLGFSYVKSLHLVLATGLVVSAITFYLWMRTLFKRWSSVVGAIFYMLAPYHLVDVYIRGSVGEIWALALAPLVLFFTTKLILRLKSNALPPKASAIRRAGPQKAIAIRRAGTCQDNSILVLNSVSLFLLLLSHNILGPIFYIFGLLYGFILNLLIRKSKNKIEFKIREAIKDLFVSYSLGFMLAGFFWIPVIFDRKYVTGLNIIDPTNHFPQLYQLLVPSWGTGFSGINNTVNQMSFQIGVPHLLVIIGIFALPLFGLLSALQHDIKLSLNVLDLLPWFMFTILLGSIILILSISEPVWRSIEIMHYFQYPWRILSLVVLTGSFLASYFASGKPKILVPTLLFLAFVFYLPYTKPVVYPARGDSFYLENPIWTKGTATLGNSFRAKMEAKEKINNSIARKTGGGISLLSLGILVIIFNRK